MALVSRIPEIAARLAPEVQAATHDGAELVAEDARARVPKVTGRLERAIHVEDIPDGAAVVAGDSEAWYGHLVEHGHTAQDGSSVAPHPFLVPALEENRVTVEEEVAKAIRKASK